jgi:hypothetical protein
VNFNFRDAVGFEGILRISNCGIVYSCRTNKILCLAKSKSGYPCIATTIGGRGGKHYFLKVHRLVASAFVPNPDKKPYVNHKDGIKCNNHYTNLEWVTPKENAVHAAVNGLITPMKGEDNPASKLTYADVETIRSCYKPYCRVNGARALGRKFGVNKGTIIDAATGKTWCHEVAHQL